MLLDFERDLPTHKLDIWLIEALPEGPSTFIENNDKEVGHSKTENRVRIRGYGKCSRCKKEFKIMTMGNSIASNNQESIDKTVRNMKAWTEKDAEKDGPCWGDTPEIPNEENFAIMD